MALSFCSAAVDVALRGSVAHENDIAELDLATLKHAGKYLHTLDGTSTDANLIAPLVTDFISGNCTSYAIKSVKHSNTYLRAHPGGAGATVDTQTYIGSWERFTFQGTGSGWYSIKSVKHGTYLRGRPIDWDEYEVYYRDVDQQTYVGSQEKFKPEFENGHVSILSTDGTYISAHPGGEGSRVKLQTYSGSWEKFDLICSV